MPIGKMGHAGAHRDCPAHSATLHLSCTHAPGPPKYRGSEQAFVLVSPGQIGRSIRSLGADQRADETASRIPVFW